MTDPDERYGWSEGRDEPEGGRLEGIVLGCIVGAIIWVVLYVIWRVSQ